MRIPILKLGRVLLTSIQADLNDDDAGGLQSEVLSLFQRDEADGLVLDISGLDVVDSYMARLLNETARMVRIMGSEVVLTGMAAHDCAHLGRDGAGNHRDVHGARSGVRGRETPRPRRGQKRAGLK